jgi:hypothetical protein
MKPLIRRSDLTDPPRYYVLTRYHIDGPSVVASTKYEVTDQIEALFPAAASSPAAPGLRETPGELRTAMRADPLGYREGRAAVWAELAEYVHQNREIADRMVALSDGPLPSADDVRGILAETPGEPE